LANSSETVRIRTLTPKPTSPLTGDLGAVKQALEFVRKGKIREATIVKYTLEDELAQKLVE
jgi:soluble lytic murein transglycosylase